MGHWTDSGGIRRFTPEDNDNKLYIEYNIPMGELLSKITAKWPEVPMELLVISAAHIHTDYLGYDRHDESDYTDYLIVTRF